MTFTYRRSYRGKLQAAIFDWAGTVLDYGCLAPAVTFIKGFQREGVEISVQEAREPMGAHKRVHIQKITQMEPVRQRWIAKHGKPPTEADVERMYQAFIPLQIECLSNYSTLIRGTLEVVAQLRARGCKIGATTGYSTEMTAVNLRDAARQGYRPDHAVSATEVPAGRPFPHMCLENVIHLGVSTVEACLKVDDTRPGIEEGLSAGMWTIGVAVSGNEVGLSLADWEKLSEAERGPRRAVATERLAQSGAHYVVDSIADIMPCIDDIEARLARGEKP